MRHVSSVVNKRIIVKVNTKCMKNLSTKKSCLRELERELNVPHVRKKANVVRLAGDLNHLGLVMKLYLKEKLNFKR